jgi:uncharacterized protein YjbI with pentapeptide repeats
MVFGGVTFQDDVDFSGMNLTGTRIAVKMHDAKYVETDISRTQLRACITGEQLATTRNYRDGDLSGLAFEQLDLSRVDFCRQNLTRAVFSTRCDLTDADFEDAVITGARFYEDTKGLTAEQIKSTWNYKNRRMQTVTLPKSLADAIEQTN